MKRVSLLILLVVLLAMLLPAVAMAGEPKVTICHVPPGNPANAHEITIGEPAVAAHLANHEGDFVVADNPGLSCPQIVVPPSS